MSSRFSASDASIALDTTPNNSPNVGLCERAGRCLPKRVAIGLALILVLAVIVTSVGVGVHFGTKASPANATSATPTVPPVPRIKRLPTAIVPLIYRLNIKAYLPNSLGGEQNLEKHFTFEGSENITVECREQTNLISLHALNLNISHIRVTNARGDEVHLDGNFTEDKDQQQISVKTVETLNETETYNISIGFEGTLNTNDVGFYRSSYAENNTTRWMAVTQFEPTSAREAFPCFDEPSFKAVFEVAIIHTRDMTALSNGMELRTNSAPPPENDENWKKTTFAPTPKMSTYLLAFVIGHDLSKINKMAETRQQTQFRIWGRQEQLPHLAYAADVGTKALEFYENYFNVTFPLQKQDMVVIPDFANNAMENWGIITYRENSLLYDAENYSPYAKYWAASTITHELAHQWFGNLVTMDWWEDLWLNEGFATLISYLGSDAVDENFHASEMFIVEEVQKAMALDQLASSRPISRKIETEADILSFDAIAYAKGSAILAMIRSVIEEDAFQQGLHEYLTKHAYGNADLNDLTTSLTKAVQRISNSRKDWKQQPLNVTEFAQSWLLQMGYPVLTVERISNGIQITQKRFKSNEAALDDRRYQSAFGYKWNIPVWYQANHRDSENFTWLSPDENHTTITSVANADLVILNPDVKGFYRVNYDIESWQRIRKQLLQNHTVFSAKTRSQMLDDAFEMAKSNQLSYEVALSLTCYLSNELDYLPWSTALKKFGFFRTILVTSDDYGTVKKFLRALILPAKAKLEDVNSGSILNSYLKHDLWDWACRSDYEGCLNQSRIQFLKYLHECGKSISSKCSSKIPPNSRSTVYCNGIAQTGENEWNQLWQLYLKEPVYKEKITLLAALGCSNDSSTLKRLLNETIEGKTVKSMDIETVADSIGSNPVGINVFWKYLVANWNATFERLGQLAFYGISSLTEAATIGFSNQTDADEFGQFIRDHSMELAKGLSKIKQQLELVQTNVQWNSEHRHEFLAWFQARNCANL